MGERVILLTQMVSDTIYTNMYDGTILRIFEYDRLVPILLYSFEFIRTSRWYWLW